MQSASATYIAVLFCVEYWLFAQLQQAHKAVEESAMKCWGYITFLLQLCPPAHRSQVYVWAMPYTALDNPEGNQVASWSPRLLHCTSRATCMQLGEEYPREDILRSWLVSAGNLQKWARAAALALADIQVSRALLSSVLHMEMKLRLWKNSSKAKLCI